MKRLILIIFGLIGIIVLCSGIVLILYNPAGKITFVNEASKMQTRLNIPPLLTGASEGGQSKYNLTIEEGKTASSAGKHATIGINDNYLGPTIRMRTGDRVRMSVKNLLGEATTIHWHGMLLPAEMDGGPHQTINPGETWTPYWTVTNQAATLWYHSHAAGKSGQQVYRGLAGMLIVDDPNSDQLDLPHEYGIDDIPVIVQDRKFNRDGEIVYDHNPNVHYLSAGMLGNAILVNGTIDPYINVPAHMIRLRILNASNARRYNFGFADGRTFYQIASDGGFLPVSVARQRMILGPGERSEILIDLTGNANPLLLQSYPLTENNKLLRLAQDFLAGPTDQYEKFTILEIRPQEGHFGQKVLPSHLNSISMTAETSTAVKRTFTVSGENKDGINGKIMDPGRIDAVVQTGDTEIWTFRNASPLAHPMHVHGVQFQILSRNGKKPEAYEAGWKDTVLVGPGETVRIIMQFPKGNADPHAVYMLHCHNLEHEDMGMMAQFVVVDKNTKPKDIYIDEMTKNIIPFKP